MKHPICILLFLSIGITSNAQKQLFDPLNMPMYHARVKLLDEFMARFNGEEKRDDLADKYSDRKSSVLLLFDLAKFKSRNDPQFILADSFACAVERSHALLNFKDTCWYAKVKCQGTLGKKNVDFFLYLKVEARGDYMYKWTIVNAEGTIFDTSQSNEHQNLFIMPNDHEHFFSSLSRITSETAVYIDDYARKCNPDPLSVFLTLVRSGSLKIDYVEDVTFVFYQVPNYIFTVRHFERESMNVGWLIDSVESCEEIHKKDKKELLNSICK